MKVRLISGEEIECTVQEYFELKKAGQVGAPVETEPAKPIKTETVKVETKVIPNAKMQVLKGKANTMFTKEEDTILVKYRDLGYDYINQCIPYRTRHALMNRYSYLTKSLNIYSVADLEAHPPKYTKRRDITEPKAKNESLKAKSEEDGRVKRMRFITSRAKHYVNQFGWDWEQAKNKAISDYNTHSGTNLGKVSPTKKVEIKSEDLEFPSIYPIHEDAIPQLESTIQNMLGTTKKLCYFDVNWMRLQGDLEWSGRLWAEFVTQFIISSSKIAKAFNIPNKFKHKKDWNQYDIIVYDGEGK